MLVVLIFLIFPALATFTTNLICKRFLAGVHIGARSETGAKALWQSLLLVDRQCAICLPKSRGSLCGCAAEQAASGNQSGKWSDQSD
ncbi:hypothetical protein [Trichocoleus sp. DQ-U1]|uniref:hypothetical protein n=1 Tax=Trichocoleus sp. DQ-U1 TaxID=2933926 RepID=UPI003299D18C